MREGKKVQPAKTDTIIQKVYNYRAYPNNNDANESRPRDVVPLDDRSFREPIQIMIRVGKGDEAHDGQCSWGLEQDAVDVFDVFSSVRRNVEIMLTEWRHE